MSRPPETYQYPTSYFIEALTEERQTISQIALKVGCSSFQAKKRLKKLVYERVINGECTNGNLWEFWKKGDDE